jgi:hypothetical protein
MKTKVQLIISISVILMGSCKNETISDDSEIKKITAQRDSVIQLANKKDSSISAFVASFAEIENNLVNIKQKEEMLSFHSKKNVELSKGVKSQVDESIKIINDLMEQNRQKIITLNTKLKDANYTINQLKGLVDILITNINNKNQDLIELNKALIANGKMTGVLNTAMIDFGAQSASKSDTIDQIKTKLNTAYYVIGDASNLKERKIVTEKGGFFSPNQYEKLNPDFNMAEFTKIDTKQTKNIKITGKTVKLITNHPSNSYKLENAKSSKPIVNLLITDPEKFWAESKFLVIMTD